MMKKQESGRSMVEMLGVLAIIGVLSIGGIAGYTMAMRRYRANAVLDAANKYATIVYSGWQTAKTMGAETTYQVPVIAKTGITPNSASTVSGATITVVGQPTEDGVKIEMVFEDSKICDVAASSIGATTDQNGCTSKKLTYTFAQS